jgi:hypothetical protein
LGHTASITVHFSKCALRHDIALVRSELEQRRSPHIILGHTLSLMVHESK